MLKLLVTVTALVLNSMSLASATAAVEIAKVNSHAITVDEFNSKFRESMKFFRYKAPTKKNVLEEMINRDLGIQEARRLGLDKDPEVVDRINTVLYHSLLDKKLSSKFDSIQISNEEVEAFYKHNPEIRTSHIFVQVRVDASAAQEKAASEKITKLKGILEAALKEGKQTFADIARAHSEGVAAPTGGDIDYQTKDKLDPTYYAAAIKLKPGEISPIVRSQFGYHLIKLTGVKEFKEVDKGHFRRLLFDEKRAAAFEAYMSELRQRAKITVNYDLLKD